MDEKMLNLVAQRVKCPYCCHWDDLDTSKRLIDYTESNPLRKKCVLMNEHKKQSEYIIYFDENHNVHFHMEPVCARAPEAIDFCAPVSSFKVTKYDAYVLQAILEIRVIQHPARRHIFDGGWNLNICYDCKDIKLCTYARNCRCACLNVDGSVCSFRSETFPYKYPCANYIKIGFEFVSREMHKETKGKIYPLYPVDYDPLSRV